MRNGIVIACFLLLAACRPEPPLEVMGTVPDFVLTSQANSEFRSADTLHNRIWVADFVYTSCTGPCPRMSSQMRQVQDATPDLPDLRLVTFTVDPARDTPEVLAAYAERQHAAGRWFFLTGAMESLHKLKRDVFLLGNIDGQLNHSTRFVLVDRQSRIRAYYDTSEAGSIKQLLRDIRRLDKE